MQPISFTGLPRANVLGVGVHATTMEEAVRLSGCLLQSGTQSYVCLTGVHGVMEAQRDAQLRSILNRAALCLPDGMPMVWLGRAQGHHAMSRVYGPDYMAELCRWGAPATVTFCTEGSRGLPNCFANDWRHGFPQYKSSEATPLRLAHCQRRKSTNCASKIRLRA